jgi:hypothetical protein
MKTVIALAILLVGVCLVQQSNGWYFGFRPWGFGLGYGLGYGGLGYGGWGWPYYRYYRDTMSKGDISGRVQCRYIQDKSVLSCNGQSGVVDCNAVANFTALESHHKFELFGLGIDKSVDYTKVQTAKYFLYPRSVDNKIWYNHTIRVEKEDVQLALFHSWTYKYYGFRVTDFTCYERLVNLFSNANVDEEIRIGEVTPAVTTRLFGEVLIHNQQVQA